MRNGEAKSQSAAEHVRLIDVLNDPKIDTKKVYYTYMEKNRLLDNAPDDNGQTPLHYLANKVKDKKGLGINLLLEAGAKVDVLDNERRSPLHIAASMGKTEVMHELIRAGANVNLRDHQGGTPLSLFLCSLSQNRDLKKNEMDQSDYLNKSVYLIQKMRALGANVTAEASIGVRNIGIFSRLPHDLIGTISSFVGFMSELPPAFQYLFDIKPKFIPAKQADWKISDINSEFFSGTSNSRKSTFYICQYRLIECAYAFDSDKLGSFNIVRLWLSDNGFDELTDIQRNLVCKELYKRPLIGFPFIFNKDSHTIQNDEEAVKNFLKNLYSFELSKLQKRMNSIWSDLKNIKYLSVEQACQVVKGFDWILSSNCESSWFLESYSFQAIDRVIKQDKRLIEKLQRLENNETLKTVESDVDESDSEHFEEYIFLCKYLQQLEMLFNIASIDLTQLRGEDKKITLDYFLSRQSQQNAETADDFQQVLSQQSQPNAQTADEFQLVLSQQSQPNTEIADEFRPKSTPLCACQIS